MSLLAHSIDQPFASRFTHHNPAPTVALESPFALLHLFLHCLSLIVLSSGRGHLSALRRPIFGAAPSFCLIIPPRCSPSRPSRHPRTVRRGQPASPCTRRRRFFLLHPSHPSSSLYICFSLSFSLISLCSVVTLSISRRLFLLVHRSRSYCHFALHRAERSDGGRGRQYIAILFPRSDFVSHDHDHREFGLSRRFRMRLQLRMRARSPFTTQANVMQQWVCKLKMLRNPAAMPAECAECGASGSQNVRVRCWPRRVAGDRTDQTVSAAGR